VGDQDVGDGRSTRSRGTLPKAGPTHPVVRRWVLLAIVAAFGMSTVVGAGGAETATPVKKKPPGAVASRVATGTGIIRWGSSYTKASGYDRFQYVFVTRHDAPRARRLKATTLVYASGTSIKQGWSTGVTYAETVANGWLLHDANGRPLVNAKYEAYIADVGSRAYQKRFVGNMTTFLRKSGAEGVFIDDVISDPTQLNRDDRAWPTKYPTQAAWEDAIVSFVQNVGSALKARGFYVVVNAHKHITGDLRSNDGTLEVAFWRRLAPSVSGLSSEYWLQNPLDIEQLRQQGPHWTQQWAGWQRLVRVAQSAGADFFGVTYGASSNEQAMRYGRGSFLLDWDGHGGAFIYAMTDRDDPFHTTWTTYLGRPSKQKFQRLPGVWQRRYERGIVVVNSTGAPVTVRVNGALATVAPTDALFSRNP
jgi:Hypothetical glycosyl hydrolase family 15